jgi:spectinomycin phosphotransferase
MREPPPHVTDEDVLATVAEHWAGDVDRIGHLPVGFGAYHWRVSGPDTILFVTLDQLGDRHTPESLEAAYAGAAALADSGLEFVLAPLATHDGRRTVPFEGGALSVTPWRVGTTSGERTMSAAVARSTRAALERLHATTPPNGLPRWRPLVSADLADDLAKRTSNTWYSGPYGEEARAAIREHLDQIAEWTAAYHRLAATTDPATWVPTHGEPHTGNQLVTPEGTLFIDWESLKLAPRERDLRTLDDAGYPQPDAEDDLVEMFDLEWRLDEISQYATWFEQWHTGTASDAIALGGLTGELTREGRHTRK